MAHLHANEEGEQLQGPTGREGAASQTDQRGFLSIQPPQRAWTDPKLQSALRMNDPAVFLKDGRGMRRVLLRDIEYLTADGNYVKLHLREGRVVLRNSMAEVLKALTPYLFLMINRSQAVNIELIDHITTEEVTIGRTGLTLSRRYRDELISHLHIIAGR